MNEEKKLSWQKIFLDLPTQRVSTEPFQYAGGDEDEGNDEEKIPRILMTSAGLFRVNVSHPLSETEFYQCYTNFPISKKLLALINSCPGVEYITYLSRYTFTIGVGRLFDAKDVRVEVEYLLTDGKKHADEMKLKSIADTDLRSKAIQLRNELRAKHDKWAMLIFPNSFIETIGYSLPTSDELSYNSDMERLLLISSQVGGLFLSGARTTSEEIT